MLIYMKHNARRFLLLCLLWLLANAGLLVAQDGTLRRIRVPVLMYHYVDSLPPNADPLRIGLTVRPETLRAQLAWLRDAGYNTISFDQLHAALTMGATLPPKPLILSFDDGYSGHFTTVLPLLLEAGYTATFFVISERAENGDLNHLSRGQVAAMTAAGMYMGSHSRSHRELVGRDRDLLVFELLGSRESLQAFTGVAPRVLAWPFGSYDAMALQIAQEAGYQMAVSTRPGMLHSSSERLELARLRVNRDLSLAAFAALLRGDWLNEGA